METKNRVKFTFITELFFNLFTETEKYSFLFLKCRNFFIF